MDVSAPIELSEVQEARSENIIEIALDFSGMLRVFEEGSNVKIIPKLRELFKQLDSINEKAAYDSAHAEFCNWFVANIRTAQKKLKSGGIKASGAVFLWARGQGPGHRREGLCLLLRTAFHRNRWEPPPNVTLRSGHADDAASRLCESNYSGS